MKRSSKRVWLLGLLAILGLPVAGVLWLRTSLPRYSGSLTVSGLSGPVDIVRDSRAIPHIFAGNFADALFALGYAHGQDRLFMLEFYRLQSQGRLAELLGPDALPGDRFVRIIGQATTEKQILAVLSPLDQRRMQAYASGINAFLETRTGALPPEFVYLGIRPAPWTVTDMARIGNLTALERDGWQRELLRIRLAARLPARVLDAVLAGYDEVPADSLRAAFALVEPAPPFEESGPAIHLPRLSVASNAWAAAPARSATGGALFAADPHMELVLPTTYTPARISTPEVEFAGFVIPTVAWFVGRNGFLTWAMTHAVADQADIFVERLDSTGTKYLTPEGWVPIHSAVESLAVRGGPTTALVVRSTRHGPIISDHVPEAEAALEALGPGLALAAAGLTPTGGAGDGPMIVANHEITLSRDLAEVARAMTGYLGVDNLIQASRSGAIAIRQAIPRPRRRVGDGSVALPGWSADSDRVAPIEGSDTGFVSDPPCGIVFNANGRLVTGAEHCTRSGSAAYRTTRLSELLAAQPKHTLETFQAIQLDTKSLAGLAFVDGILRITPRDRHEAQALDLLRTWDGSTGLQSQAALVFHQWLYEFDNLIIGAKRATLALPLPSAPPHVLARMLRDGSAWCAGMGPDESARTCDAVAAMALTKAVGHLRSVAGDDLDGWRWGEFHHAVFGHPIFSGVNWLRWFGERRVPIPGGTETINPGGSRGPAPFLAYGGPQTRRLEDLLNPANNRVAFAAGVSGNPLSRFYDDQLGPWARGEYFSMEGSREEIERTAIGTLRLIPAPIRP